MKRIFNFSILIVGISIVFSGCNPKCPVNTGSLQFAQANSTYWGDFYGNGNSIFDIVLSDNDLARSTEGNLNGAQAIFDINASPGSKEVPAGTYKSSTTGNAFTFQRGANDEKGDPAGSYIRIWRNDKVSEVWLITSGNLIVQKSGQYTFSGMITTEHNIAYEIRYSGAMKTSDVTPWPETLAKGQVIYNGRVTGNNGDRNMFTLLLGGKDVTFPELNGNDDAMSIELYAPVNITNTIPNGTYIVEVETKGSFRIMDGFVDNGKRYGTWYYTTEPFEIKSGDMIVTVVGNTYKLDYRFFIFENLKGLRISGVYNGTMGYVNASATPKKSILRAPMNKSAENPARKSDKLTSTNRATAKEDIRAVSEK